MDEQARKFDEVVQWIREKRFTELTPSDESIAEVVARVPWVPRSVIASLWILV